MKRKSTFDGYPAFNCRLVGHPVDFGGERYNYALRGYQGPIRSRIFLHKEEYPES